MTSLFVVFGPANVSGGIEIYNAFDDHGLIDEDFLKATFSESVSSDSLTYLSEGRIGHFSDGEQLRRFCFVLCQRLKLEGVNIMNVEQFNKAIETSQNTSELVSSFQSSGDHLVNVDAEKKGFFDGLFGALKP